MSVVVCAWGFGPGWCLEICADGCTMRYGACVVVVVCCVVAVGVDEWWCVHGGGGWCGG